MPAQDHTPTDASALAAGRETIRQVRDAGREAVREARRLARDSNREARESILAAMRDAREQEREARERERAAARQARVEARGGGEEAGTRSRIQRVALDLFTDKGYEATSLREIAEQLGVTKAALYYHFKTKDEIVESLIEDRLRQINELIEWGRTQPRTLETRRELLRRYSALLDQAAHHRLMRFAERNQSSISKHPGGAKIRDQMLDLHQLLVEPDSALTDQIRSSIALFALHSVWFTVRDPNISEAERSEAALTVALELLDASHPQPTDGGSGDPSQRQA